MGFRFRDSFSHPWSSAPSGRYTLAAGTFVTCASGTLHFTAGTTTLLKSINGSDYTFGDQYVRFKFSGRVSSPTSKFSAILRYSSSTTFYRVEFNFSGAAYNIFANTTSIASGTVTTFSAGDIFYADVIGTGASCTIRFYRNGVLVRSFNHAASTFDSGQAGVSASTSGSGTIDLDDLDLGPATSASTPDAPIAGTYTGRLSPVSFLSRVGLYCSSYDSGESNAQGQCIDALWNPGGGSSDWAGYLSSCIGQYLPYGYRRVVFRGPGGNNSIGCRFGDSYTTTLNPTPAQCVSNPLGLRFCDIYRNTTDSGFTTVMSDSRLLDNFQTAWQPYLALLDEIEFYHCLPPNGVKVDGSGGGTPTAYANSSVAFDEWDQEYLNLGAVSTRAGVSVQYDTSGPLDLGGSAGSTPAANVAAKAYCDWLRSGRTHRSAVEPNPEQNQGGTNANSVYFTVNRFSMVGVTSPTPASDLILRAIKNPGGNFGREDLAAGTELIAWLDGSWLVPTERFNAAMYYLGQGCAVRVEPSGLSASQHRALVAAGSPSARRTGRSLGVVRSLR